MLPKQATNQGKGRPSHEKLYIRPWFGAAHTQSVIIVGPPWPRSAALRVIQTQVQYYRQRGFSTVFVGVPFLWDFKYLPEISARLPQGVTELDADRVFVATFDDKTYNSKRYHATNWRAFSGTALDWQVAIARACRLREEEMNFMRKLQPALFHVNHLYTLGFALCLRKQLFGPDSRPPLILETHDVQSHLTHQKGDRNPGTARPDGLQRLIKSEVSLLKKADVLIHISRHDFAFFQRLLPSKPQFLVFPTIDEKFRSRVKRVPSPPEAIDLLFVGQWHPANFVGIRWFLQTVWPLIVDRNYSLKIVGAIGHMVQRKSPKLYKAFCACFVGEVVDLVPYYRAARCVIAPMRWGTGISIKTVEALSLGKPFVGTSTAFRGMPMERLKEAGLLAHDDAKSFARAISLALSRERQAASISRAVYEDVFSNRASFATRDAAFRAAGPVEGRRHRSRQPAKS